MTDDEWVDAFLADAAVEIDGWHHSDPPSVDAEYFFEYQMEVLRRMEEEC